MFVATDKVASRFKQHLSIILARMSHHIRICSNWQTSSAHPPPPTYPTCPKSIYGHKPQLECQQLPKSFAPALTMPQALDVDVDACPYPYRWQRIIRAWSTVHSGRDCQNNQVPYETSNAANYVKSQPIFMNAELLCLLFPLF